MKPKLIFDAALVTAFLCSLVMARLAAAAVSKADAGYTQAVADRKTPTAGVLEKTGREGWWARTWNTADGSGFYGKTEVKTATENTDTNIVPLTRGPPVFCSSFGTQRYNLWVDSPLRIV